MNFETLAQFEGNFTAIATVGGVGVLLGVICLIAKHNPKDDKVVCLVSSIVNQTFIAITFVGVVTISINLAIYLPQISQTDYDEDVKSHIGDLVDEQTKALTKLYNAPSVAQKTLTQEIEALGPQQAGNSEEIAAIVRRHIPVPIRLHELVFETDIGIISCVVDGRYHCSIDNLE